MHRRNPLRAAGLFVALALVAGGSFGTARADVTVLNGTAVSFDGTKIAYTLFLPTGADAANQVPVVFYTHGWGGARATSATDGTVKLFNDNGFAVLTWDARGFGVSGGEANVDSQEFEVRDVAALIDIAGSGDEALTKNAIRLDAAPDPDTATPGDPRMGMYGGSYAGGIQLETAAADTRVDAIAPEIAWNDLPQALKPYGVFKLGWDLLLYGSGLATGAANGASAGETGAYAPQIHKSFVEANALNDWTNETADWFDSKSPKNYIEGATLADGRVLPGVNAPALIIQGISDTLFPINQGIANFNTIRARVGADKAKMILFCGGHTIVALGTSCATAGNRAVITDRLVKWMNRWVKGDTTVDTGAAIEVQLQSGTWLTMSDLPSTEVAPLSADTRVTHTIAPTSGQATAPTPNGCAYQGTGALPSTTWARDQVNRYQECGLFTGDWLPVGTMTGPALKPPACGSSPKPPCTGAPTFEWLKPGTQIVGVPRLRVRLFGTAPEAYVFFKLVDYDKNTKKAVVIDDQVTPVKATWLSVSQARYYDVEMNGVAWEVKADHHIYLEVSPNSNDHAVSRVPGSTTVYVDASIPGIPAA